MPESMPEQVNWPRRMLAVLAQAEPRASLGGEVVAWNLKPGREAPHLQGDYREGLHHHGYLELCVMIQGIGIMTIDGRRYRMRYPAMVVINPGVQHTEGFERVDRGYTTMWLLWKEQGLHALANTYQAGWGWSSPWAGTLPRINSLERWGRPPHRVDLDNFDHFRARLLTPIAKLVEQTHEHGSIAPPSRNYVTAGHQSVLRWVRQHLDHHYAQPLTLTAIAAMTRYSPQYLDMLFSRWAGMGIRAYLIERRMQHALALCRETTISIRGIAAQVGYADALYFSRAFRRYHGCTPTQARLILDGGGTDKRSESASEACQ